MALMKMLDGKEVMCSPEEEQEILASWEVGKIIQSRPKKPSSEDKLNWFFEGGQQLVDQNMKDYQEKEAVFLASLEAVKLEHEKHYNNYVQLKTRENLR